MGDQGPEYTSKGLYRESNLDKEGSTKGMGMHKKGGNMQNSAKW